MKKYFFILIVFLIMIVTVRAKTKSDNKFNSLNSQQLLVYLNKQDLNGKKVLVCNKDYCDYLKYESLEKSVKVYVSDYINFVKEKTDEDTSLRVSLKGFLITEVNYF